MTVYGSLQCPYYVHKALVVLLKLPPDRVRVVQTETGGGFGGKEEYPSMLACHAAILARKANRPVKMIYDRVEDLLATTKRHPSIVRHRTGLTRDGRITAMDIDVIMDGGAYATLSAVVLSRGVIHAAGPYRCDHVRIRGRAMMTHTPPNGAFRGFGAPQTQFAIEAHIDRIADRARHRSGPAARDQRAAARRYHRDRPEARQGRERAAGAARCRQAIAVHAEAQEVERHQPRHRPVAVLPRLRLHRRRRGQARLEGLARADRERRADPRRQHGDRTGHAHDARADRRRRAGRAVRRDRRERGRHRVRARQRTHRGVAHLHDRRQAARALRARHEEAARQADAGAVFQEARVVHRHRRSTSRRPDCSGTTTPTPAMPTAATPGAATSSSSRSIRSRSR